MRRASCRRTALIRRAEILSSQWRRFHRALVSLFAIMNLRWRAGKPSMAVIGISQQIGSRGIELGELAARELGYRFQPVSS